MHVPTHILSGWCFANLISKLDARERLFCMIAASVQDLDGIGIVGDFLARHDEPIWYWDLHHKLGHGALACIVVTSILTVFSSRPRWVACLAYVIAFHLHLILDFFGSGPNWDIYYGWPLFSDGWVYEYAWPLSSWQNVVAALVLLAWTLWIVRRHKRTPLEMLVPSLDRRWVTTIQSIGSKAATQNGPTC